MKYNGLLILVFSSFILLTGCWDQKETGDVALVMGMGIDKVEDDQYQVSFQIVNPGQVAGGKTSRQGTPVTTYATTGESIFETIRKVSNEVPRMLSFSHTSIVIIGEDLAKEEGLIKVLDFIERYHDFRSTSLMLIARGGQAYSVLSILSPLETIPALNIQQTVEKTGEVWGETTERNVNDVVRALTSGSKGLTLGGVSIIGAVEEGQAAQSNQQAVSPTTVRISGLATFKEGKLQTWLDDQEARGVAWVQNKIKRTVLTAQCPEKDGLAGVEILRANTTMKGKVEQGNPKVTLNINAEGHLNEISCPIDLTNPQRIFELNQLFTSKIKEEINTAIKVAKEEENDIFGFGEAINRANPGEWKKLKADWNETFVDMEVEVNVKVFIRATGLRDQPLIFQKQKKGGG